VKIGVCLKQVPASDSRIKISDPSAGIDTSEVKWEINPYDEYALEAGLRLVDAKVATEVVIFSVGGKPAEARIREALARGAKSAVRIDDAAMAGSDCLGISRALAAAIQAEDIQLVFTGKQAIDGDNSQVPAMIAELLGWPQATTVSQFELEGETVKAWRSVGGGSRDVVQMNLPAVVSCDKGMNQPRYAYSRAS
jgi:electron transfer flavoprotein beta subunit